MNALPTKTIALSKTKILLLAAGSIMFVLMGFWLFASELSSFNDPFKVQVAASLSIAFSATCALFAGLKFFDKRPGLVLSSEGIFDNASAVAAGLIPWADIKGFSILEINKQQALIVQLVDPQKYVEMGNPLRRMLNRANFKLCASPVAIGSTALQCHFVTLVKDCNEYFQQYKGGGHQAQ